MIIGVIENSEVRVFEDIDEVMREWKPYPSDVASEVIVFYDEDGTWLEPVFKELPRRWFGLKGGIEFLELRRSSSHGKAIDPINLALYEAKTLVPNRHVSSLEELRSRFLFSK